MRKYLIASCSSLILSAGIVNAAPLDQPAPELLAEARSNVQEMKNNPRGPYSRIRWYCNDGTTQAPVACAWQPEEGFRCDKYMGNVRNKMNSVAIVEGAAADEPHYVVSLMSDVLRFNSAWDHSRIVAAVHETIRTRATQRLQENASQLEMQEAGKSE